MTIHDSATEHLPAVLDKLDLVYFTVLDSSGILESRLHVQLANSLLHCYDVVETISRIMDLLNEGDRSSEELDLWLEVLKGF